jgi:anti-anti-sigma factor
MMNTPKLTKTMIIEPKGYVTAANIGDFQEQLKQAISNPNYSLFLVDMSRVEFLDSAGLMALASGFRLAQHGGKRLSICCIPPAVKIIFELTQLDRILDIYETREVFNQSLSGNSHFGKNSSISSLTYIDN